jgi:hypothetical protein
MGSRNDKVLITACNVSIALCFAWVVAASWSATEQTAYAGNNECCLGARAVNPSPPQGSFNDCVTSLGGFRCSSSSGTICVVTMWQNVVSGTCPSSNTSCTPGAATTNVTFNNGAWSCGFDGNGFCNCLYSTTGQQSTQTGVSNCTQSPPNGGCP